MSELASLQATVRGHVQGVFYRAFVESRALELRLTGYVRNLPDNRVEIVAEGEKINLKKLAALLKKGPPASRVEGIEITWGIYAGEFSQFAVKY
jgi:acylphosphatase